MTPAARLQAVIELLAEIEAQPRPADAVASEFFRKRRFIGSKDRVAVAESVYGVLRHWGRLCWWLDRAKHERDARAFAIAELVLSDRLKEQDVETLFSGGKYAPWPLSDTERALVRALETHTLDHPQQPDGVRSEVPEWAEPGLRQSLGEHFTEEMRAMLAPAPVDLRVNPVKAARAQARKALEAAGVKAEPTALSPLGLRLQGRVAVAQLQPFKDGWIEVQDEGSQLVALIADARPGHQVVDFCAGAGGKTLAIAAGMANKGRVVAADVLERRLERARERFRRAGLHNIETRALSNERDPWVKRHKGKFDRVVVDAPCSGTGTWRRNPDARWRLLGPGIAELLVLQRNILDSACRLVKPGGRLVYATCSLLAEENQGQVESFLATHPEFRLVPLAEAWPQKLGPVPGEGAYLSLSPARNGTDGFFAAVLERAPAAPSAAAGADAEVADAAAESGGLSAAPEGGL